MPTNLVVVHTALGYIPGVEPGVDSLVELAVGNLAVADQDAVADPDSPDEEVAGQQEVGLAPGTLVLVQELERR